MPLSPTRKPTMFFALALVLALLPAPASTPSALAKAQASTVMIHATVTKTQLVDEEGEDLGSYGPKTTTHENICSGYVAYTQRLSAGVVGVTTPVYASLVVTAAHCTRSETVTLFDIPIARYDIDPDSVTFKDGEQGLIDTMLVPGSERADDIAFLGVLTTHPHPALWPALSLPAQGEPLFVYGMPLGQAFAYSPAVMMQDHHLYSDDDPTSPPWEHNGYLIACPSCGPGDSGGPVLNMRGQVVGIVNAGGGSAQTIMFPLERLRMWLAQFDSRQRSGTSIGCCTSRGVEPHPSRYW